MTVIEAAQICAEVLLNISPDSAEAIIEAGDNIARVSILIRGIPRQCLMVRAPVLGEDLSKPVILDIGIYQKVENDHGA